MGQYCFARWRLSSSSVVCNSAGGRAGAPPAAQAVGQQTRHGGTVVLRPVRATPCFHNIVTLLESILFAIYRSAQHIRPTSFCGCYSDGMELRTGLYLIV